MLLFDKNSKELLYPYRHGLSFSFYEGIAWMIASATPMVLLLQQLGGSTFAVGLAFSFAFIMLPVQVVATSFLRKFGYRKQTIISLVLRTIFLCVPPVLAFTASEKPPAYTIILMVLSFFFVSLFRATGNAALFPWLYHLLPVKARGRYFAFEQFSMNSAAMLALLVSSLFFYYFELYYAFFIIYAVAILGSLCAIQSLSKLQDFSNPETLRMREMWMKTKKLCTTPGPFRFYLLSNSAWFALGTPLMPFVIYYLNDNAGFTDGSLMLFTGIMYLGCIFGALLIRRKVDLRGGRPYFIYSLVSCALIKIFWILILTESVFFVKLIPWVFFLNGISHVMWQIAHYKYVPSLCSKEDRALGVALQTAISGLVGGLSAIVWGYILRAPGSGTELESSTFKLYLYIAFIVFSLLIFPYMRLGSESLNLKKVSSL